jgi:hypothetical protein
MIDEKLQIILKEFNYNLSYSYNDQKLSEAFLKHLGKSGYNKFWKSVFAEEKINPYKIEEFIMKKLSHDVKGLKLLFSGQIAISYEILKVIFEQITISLKNLKNVEILELGGFDGWASCFLKRNLEISSTVTMVDSSAIHIIQSKDIHIVNSTYSEFQSENPYDIVFSILGTPFDKVDELIDCCKRNTKTTGSVYLGLRVQPNQDKIVIEKFKKMGFIPILPNPIRIKVELDTGIQFFPIYCFYNSD